jgi:hypothetical protein
MGYNMKDSLKRLVIKRGSLLAALLMFVTVPIPGWEGNPTGFQLSHHHAKKYIAFNSESIEANTNLAVINKDSSRDSDRLNDLRRRYEDHESKLYILLDDDDNFKSDLKRKIWERHDDKFKKDIERFEERMRGYESSFNEQRMIATRDP